MLWVPLAQESLWLGQVSQDQDCGSDGSGRGVSERRPAKWACCKTSKVPEQSTWPAPSSPPSSSDWETSDVTHRNSGLSSSVSSNASPRCSLPQALGLELSPYSPKRLTWQRRDLVNMCGLADFPQNWVLGFFSKPHVGLPSPVPSHFSLLLPPGSRLLLGDPMISQCSPHSCFCPFPCRVFLYSVERLETVSWFCVDTSALFWSKGPDFTGNTENEIGLHCFELQPMERGVKTKY